ncbi:hypothetical protein [Agrobacterium sp. B1(2019)]|uniref:hypothetical protein n=1 Tax=Agrobacterium sp. B1(2019) TaxID=2607032 RepID=UPI0011ECD478|nr:hypothetical protein [Agrobacterium sp. B1(2019)]TZG34282.1 hypothetical protein AGR1_16380 [Agrobacterium sp. B1(2019)]
MSVKSRTSRTINKAPHPTISEDTHARRILEATSVVAGFLMALLADKPHRCLDGMLMVVSAQNVTLVPDGSIAEKNTANIPMPRGTQVRHVLDALNVVEGDVELAIKLLSVRFAEANDTGKTLNMYTDEEIGGPSVALYLAIRALVDGKA